jgi:hypothetical protein
MVIQERDALLDALAAIAAEGHGLVHASDPDDPSGQLLRPEH